MLWKADFSLFNNLAMPNSPDQTMEVLLLAEGALLDEIRGDGRLEVEADGPDRAILRTELLEIWFGRERDNDLSGSIILLRNPPEGTEADAVASLWAKCIGIDAVPAVRNSQGWVETDPSKQIKAELTLIAKLVREIFADPRTTRDAAFYVEGYTRAYNDWASGKL